MRAGASPWSLNRAVLEQAPTDAGRPKASAESRLPKHLSHRRGIPRSTLLNKELILSQTRCSRGVLTGFPDLTSTHHPEAEV